MYVCPCAHVFVQTPGGEGLEAFAAVATEFEAQSLQPEYMQDQGFVMGDSFVRIEDVYRHGALPRRF